MSLYELDQAIAKRIAGSQYSLGAELCRTSAFLLSEYFATFPVRFNAWFPRDPRLDSIYPWLSHPENIGPMLQMAFSTHTSDAIRNAGYELVDSINQFVFLGDLSNPEFTSAFDHFHREYKKAMDSIESERMMPHTIGIFLIKHPSAGGKAVSTFSVRPEEIKERFKLLDKVYLIDSVNARGDLIGSEEDLHCLVGHCLHWIMELPLRYFAEGDPQRYSEWLRRSGGADIKVSAFSGYTLALPIKWIAKTIAVIKGIETLESVLFKEVPNSGETDSVDFINSVNANSIDVLRSHLIKNPEYRFSDPLKEMPEWSIKTAREFLRKMDTIDSSLPNCAADYRDTFNRVADKHQLESELLLDEYIANMIARMKGGLGKTSQCLERIEKHFSKMSGEIPKARTFEDPAEINIKIHEQITKGPSGPAVAVKTLLWAVVAFVGMGVIDNGIIRNTVLRLLTAVLIGSMGFVYWHAWKTRLKRRVIDLNNRVYKKWNVLLDNEIISSQRHIIENMKKTINEKKNAIEGAHKRAKNLIIFFRDKFMPDFPEGNSFWHYVSLARQDVDRIISRISVNIDEIAEMFSREESVLESWRRFGRPESEGTPNNWEWSLLERASLGVWPSMDSIYEETLCQELRECPAELNQCKQAIKIYAAPFIRTRPGSGELSISTIIEHPGSCSDIVKEIVDILKECADEVKPVDNPCRYRITCLNSADDIDADSIRYD